MSRQIRILFTGVCLTKGVRRRLEIKGPEVKLQTHRYMDETVLVLYKEVNDGGLFKIILQNNSK